jgi:hypothetical protein
MKKQEALAVLREIYDVLRETVTMNQVSLNDKTQLVENSHGYEIKMQCQFDSDCWDGVKPLLKKHSLGMKVADGFVIIYSLSAK